MQALLKTARTAIERQDWREVNITLQRLLSQERAESQPTADDLLAIALRTLENCDFQQRWEIAKLFPKLGKRAIAPLIELLETETTGPETRWFIARILGEFEDRASILALGQLIQRSEDEDLAEIAATALGTIGSAAIEHLADLLADPATRPLGVKALSRIRHPEIVPPLLTVVADDRPDIRALAIEALSSFPDRRIGPIVLSALKDPVPLVRQQAAIAAGYLARQIPPDTIVVQIEPLLRDLDREVCRASAIALGRIGTSEAVKALGTALRSPLTADDLKVTLTRALGWIGTAEAFDFLATVLSEDNERLCQEIITILARQESSASRSQAIHLLRTFYHARPPLSERTSIKQSLALALGALADPDSSPILLCLARDPEASVRLHALAALKKLA